MTVRSYLRRSKNDEGKQQFSLDVQRNGCLRFVERLGLASDTSITEYIDDGKAGDDFHTREGIRQLLAEVRPGDIIVCRDQSRLGRDALEVTLVIRELVRDHGCRLFYYANGQEVQFANAIDQVTTFIQGTGHQMELEAIRSRTREALRSRVRSGRIAGGRCYGYDLERKRDETGRPYTVAVVNPEQAAVIRRIFEDYCYIGRGLKWIATRLNEEGVPSPTVGRRGSGSWNPTGIRAMLRNPRYRGLYVHGKLKKVRRGGRVKWVEADPEDVITLEVPEWRIVDDETWLAVQEIFHNRGRTVGDRGRPSAKYPLTGIGRCGHCGGSIGSAGNRLRNGRRVTQYACIRYHTRGRSACPVSVYQTGRDVDLGLLRHLQEEVFTDDVIEAVLTEARAQIRRALTSPTDDARQLTAQLKQLRAEQKRLARAIAVVDDSPALLAELKRRTARIRRLETQLDAARRSPSTQADLATQIEATVRDKIRRLHEIMPDDRDSLRQLFLSLFPAGLTFNPLKLLDRRVWAISGAADLGGSKLGGDPSGI